MNSRKEASHSMGAGCMLETPASPECLGQDFCACLP